MGRSRFFWRLEVCRGGVEVSPYCEALQRSVVLSGAALAVGGVYYF